MKTTCYSKWHKHFMVSSKESWYFQLRRCQSHGHVCLDKKGKGSVMLLIIWLKRFSSSQSTGPQSSQLDPVCTHMPSVMVLIPESWGNGAGASGYKHLLKKKGAQPDLPTHAKRRQRLMCPHRHASEKKPVLTNGVWKNKWCKTNGSVYTCCIVYL